MAIRVCLTLGLLILDNRDLFLQEEVPAYIFPGYDYQDKEGYLESLETFIGGEILGKEFSSYNEYKNTLHRMTNKQINELTTGSKNNFSPDKLVGVIGNMSNQEIDKQKQELLQSGYITSPDQLVAFVSPTEDSSKQLAYSYDALTNFFSRWINRTRVNSRILGGYPVTDKRISFQMLQFASKHDLTRYHVTNDTAITSALIETKLPRVGDMGIDKIIKLRQEGSFEEIRNIIKKNISSIQKPDITIDDIQRDIIHNFKTELDNASIDVSKQYKTIARDTLFSAALAYCLSLNLETAIIAGTSVFGTSLLKKTTKNIEAKKRPIHILIS